MQPSVQVLEIALKVCCVGRTGQPVHAGCRILLELAERFPEVCDADMVEERGEPLLLPFPCSLPYALQRLFHGSPAWHPARALLARIPLGPSPWLPRLRGGLLRRVRRLHSYYGGVRLPASVRHRLRLLTRCGPPASTAVGQTRDIPSSDTILRHVMCSSTPAGRQCLA